MIKITLHDIESGKDTEVEVPQVPLMGDNINIELEDKIAFYNVSHTNYEFDKKCKLSKITVLIEIDCYSTN